MYIVDTYSKLLCNLSAIGASGWMIMVHVFGILTSRIAFRLILLEFDREPSVATSLFMSPISKVGLIGRVKAYQTVATPPSRDVRTCNRTMISWQVLYHAVAYETYFHDCRTWRGDEKIIAG